MKKSLRWMCIIILITMAGCGKTEMSTDNGNIAADTTNKDTDNSNTAFDTKNSDETDDNGENIISGNVPEWMLPFSELKQYSESIYLSEDGSNFELKKNKLVIPESNILIIAKKIAGRDMDVVTKRKDDILDIVKLLKSTDALEEADTSNPNGNWLGLNFDIIFLTVNSKYVLMDFDICDDNRLYVNVTTEESGSDFSFWLKSAELAEKIKSVSEYKEYDFKTCDDISNIEIRNAKNKVYNLSEDELVKMKKILEKPHEKTENCQGPFDIQLVATQKDGEIYMKWCNDDCRIIAVEGMYYKIGPEDADWLQRIVKDKMN